MSCARRDDVSESDVDLHRDARLAEQADEADTHALIVRVLADALALHGGRVEHHAVGLHVGGAHLADHSLEVLERVVEPAEEVEVFRSAPHVQHQRALEDEERTVSGRRQPVEKPLHRVVLEQLLERPLRGARLVLEAALHRGREVLDGHCIASR
jgi:hypothetical protein